MLPLGVLLQRMLADPGGRNRLLGTVLAMVLLIGAFATGLSINIEFGGAGDQGVAMRTVIDPGTGEEVVVDESGQILGDADTFELPDGATLAPFGSSTRSTSAVSSSGGDTKSVAAPRAGGDAQPPGGAGDPPGTVVSTGGDKPVGPPADQCAGATLKASDQGVTETTIKLGILVPNINELKAAGFEVGLTGDFEKITTAWVNELNSKGGIACREVIWVKDVFSVVDSDDMLRACKLMTQDEKVFAVLSAGGYDSVAALCIAKEAKTPLINPDPEPAQWYVDSAPYMWTTTSTKDRGHKNHARFLVEHELLTAEHKVGVVYDGVPHVAPAVEEGLLPELKDRGITPVRVTKLAADVEQALGQINQVVVDFNTAGVDFVFMPMNLIYKTQFMQQAQNQQYFPQYTDSDHNFGCYDFTTSTYPAESYDRTLCVTSSDVYGRVDLEEWANTHPWTQYSDSVYLKTYPEGYAEDPESDEYIVQRALHITFGSQFAMWGNASNRVGPDITRAKWGVEMGKTGKFTDCVCLVPQTFFANKFDGNTTMKLLEWHAEESDGYPERWFHEVTKPVQAYYQTFPN